MEKISIAIDKIEEARKKIDKMRLSISQHDGEIVDKSEMIRAADSVGKSMHTCRSVLADCILEE